MIQERNLVKQVVLFIITLGIYGVYWFYVTSKEMIEYKRLDGSAGPVDCAAFCPIWFTLLLLQAERSVRKP